MTTFTYKEHCEAVDALERCLEDIKREIRIKGATPERKRYQAFLQADLIEKHNAMVRLFPVVPS